MMHLQTSVARGALLLRDSQTALEVRDAVPRPQSFDAEHLTVEATIASRTPVRRRDATGEFLEILDPAGLDLAGSRGASVLDSHNQHGLDAVLGTLDAIRIEGDQVVGVIRFSPREEIAPIVDDVRAGIIQHLSVGYEVTTWAQGTDTRTGMRTLTATKWVIREASFVSVPADRTARTRGLPAPQGATAQRNRSIRELCQRAGVGETIRDDLIDRGATVEEARQVVMSELLIRGRTPIRTAHNDQTLDCPEVRVRAAGEALYLRINPAFRASPAAREFVGLTIAELARDCLRRAGATLSGLGASEVVTRALHTTSDFPLIIADTVGRTLRDAYQAAPSGIRRLARESSVKDFRKKTRIMLDSSGIGLEKVNEHGEFKSGTMGEFSEGYRIDTFGRIFGITRQALINDDLAAFSDITRRLGQAAAAFESQFLVDLLVSQSGDGPDMSDGDPLFDSNHGNKAGSGAAPAENTLSAARLAMRKQVSPAGELIAAEPKFLLIPSELETACEKLLTAIQATQTSDVNPFSKLSLIVEPRFTDAYRWYLCADPATIDGLEYSYLAGAAGPQTESQTGFRIDGVEVKVRLDYGAGFIDHRGWYTNAGH